MINKHSEYGPVKDVTVVEFGTGDVTVNIGTDKVQKIVDFCIAPLSGKHELQEIISIKNQGWEEINPGVVFRFDNQKSIDVCLYFLLKAKSELLDLQNPHPDYE